MRKFEGKADWRFWRCRYNKAAREKHPLEEPNVPIRAERKDDASLTLEFIQDTWTYNGTLRPTTDGYYGGAFEATDSTNGERSHAEVTAYLRQLEDGTWRLMGDWLEWGEDEKRPSVEDRVHWEECDYFFWAELKEVHS